MSSAGAPPTMEILDGTQLRSLHVSPPDGPLTVPQVLDLAESEAARSLFHLPALPLSLKSSALGRLGPDRLNSPGDVFGEDAAALIRDYLSSLADVLKDDPIVISILDGSSLKPFLEDEDDFAMLAENLFTEMDEEDTGKIRKGAVREALNQMGVEMGIPPFAEFPLLNDILKKHGADGEEELGQSQFAELLQPILQEVADALSEKHVTVVHNVKIANGTELRQLLLDEKQLGDIITKISSATNGSDEDRRGSEKIRAFLVRNGEELGLPPVQADEAMMSLYDAVFADIESKNLAKEEIGELLREVLEKMAELLEANPIFYDPEC